MSKPAQEIGAARWRVFEAIEHGWWGIEIDGDLDADPILYPQKALSEEKLDEIVNAHNASVATSKAYQDRVSAAQTDIAERCARFFEEAAETAQSFGMTSDEARQLVAYTFGRPAGDPAMGAALCRAWTPPEPRREFPMREITDDLHAALRPFVAYAPEECFEGNKRFSLVETTEAGGGWFGTEDFRRAKEALVAAETWVQRPSLLSAARQMVSDYQTSEHHHPNHVLVPLAAFKEMRDAIATTGDQP